MGGLRILEPDDEENNKDPDRYIHAPSLAHATTAAILRSGYLVRRSSDTLSDSKCNWRSTCLQIVSVPPHIWWMGYVEGSARDLVRVSIRAGAA